MIKILKIGNLIYQNIDIKISDEETGQLIDNPVVPTDPVELKAVLTDTIGWVVGQNIVKTIGDTNKKDASTSKAIVLFAKLINTLNPDVSKLTTNEQSVYQKMLDLASAGYSDSELLNQTFGILNTQLQWYAQKMVELETLNTFEELIAFAEGL